MAKYEQLESKIQELQKEVERLKQEEASNKLPRGFKIDIVKKIIDTGHINILGCAFDWEYTPQGYRYWYNIYCANEPLTDKAMIQLQKWVITYLELIKSTTYYTQQPTK
jgi:hypothetical protein